MTAIKEEAVQMIDAMPEEKVAFVIQYIKKISYGREDHSLTEKQKAFAELERLRLHLPEDFDEKKALREARDEKYGVVD